MEQLKQDIAKELNEILEIQEQLGKADAYGIEIYFLQTELNNLIATDGIKAKDKATKKLEQILNAQEKLNEILTDRIKDFYSDSDYMNLARDYLNSKIGDLRTKARENYQTTIETEKLKNNLDDIWNELNQIDFDNDDIDVFKPQTNNKKRG